MSQAIAERARADNQLLEETRQRIAAETDARLAAEARAQIEQQETVTLNAKLLAEQAAADTVKERIAAEEAAIQQSRARAIAEAVARKTAEAKIAAELQATTLAEEHAALNARAEQEARALAESEACLLADEKKRLDAIQQAKAAHATRLETERKLTDLAAAIAQNRTLIAVKMEENLRMAEIAAITTLGRAQAETSALAALQAKIEQEALAIERAIAREAVETMAMEAALARTRAEETAIAQASNTIREEIAITSIIQQYPGEVAPVQEEVEDDGHLDLNPSGEYEPSMAAPEQADSDDWQFATPMPAYQEDTTALDESAQTATYHNFEIEPGSAPTPAITDALEIAAHAPFKPDDSPSPDTFDQFDNIRAADAPAAPRTSRMHHKQNGNQPLADDLEAESMLDELSANRIGAA